MAKESEDVGFLLVPLLCCWCLFHSRLFFFISLLVKCVMYFEQVTFFFSLRALFRLLFIINSGRGWLHAQNDTLEICCHLECVRGVFLGKQTQFDEVN